MGIEEDKIELTGSDFERKLYDLKKGNVTQFLVQKSEEEWVFQRIKPQPGTKYIERMPDGSCRQWSNQNENDDNFQPV